MIRITPHTHTIDSNTAFGVTRPLEHRENAAKLNRIHDVFTTLETIPAGNKVIAMKKNSPFIKVTTVYKNVIIILSL